MQIIDNFSYLFQSTLLELVFKFEVESFERSASGKKIICVFLKLFTIALLNKSFHSTCNKRYSHLSICFSIVSMFFSMMMKTFKEKYQEKMTMITKVSVEAFFNSFFQLLFCMFSFNERVVCQDVG
jgi:hypothetical protein